MASVAERTARPLPRSREALRVPHATFIGVELILLLAALALAIIVKYHPGPLPGDVGIEVHWQRWLLPHQTITNAIEWVSNVSWPLPSAMVITGIMVLFLLLRRWLDALILLPTAAIADESGYITNQIVQRPRPFDHGIHIVSVIKHFHSFPSGHVIHATAVFGLLFFLTFQIRRNLHPWLWVARLALLYFIVLMGPSRILEGEHWPSDVLGGWLYGLFWLILSAHVYMWARYRWPKLLAADER